MSHTTQKLEKDTLERVRDHGKMGESFNRAIERVLDEIDDLKKRLDEHDEDLDQIEENQVQEENEDD